MWTDLPYPTIFAHRGASQDAPENTLAAFELAVNQGASAIELDAKLSRDSKVIIIHDSTVDRTTNGHGRVSDLSLAELRHLDAGSYFDYQFRGELIPTLDEVLDAVGRLVWTNIELTNYSSPFDDLPTVVARIVKRHGMQKRVLFSSFNLWALRKIKRLLPNSPVGLLALPGVKGLWARSRLGRLVRHDALHPAESDVNERLIHSIHAAGKRIHVYTVNDEERIRWLVSHGVDGIFTDTPRLAVRVSSTRQMQKD